MRFIFNVEHAGGLTSCDVSGPSDGEQFRLEDLLVVAMRALDAYVLFLDENAGRRRDVGDRPQDRAANEAKAILEKGMRVKTMMLDMPGGRMQ